MSDGSSAARWSLEDEELEALMAGATPGDLARVGNPVAEFFSDARSGRAISSPRPDAVLQQIFTAGAIVAPTVAPQLAWPDQNPHPTHRPQVPQATPRPRVEAQIPSPDPEIDEITRPQPLLAESNPPADQALAPAATWLVGAEAAAGSPAARSGLLERPTSTYADAHGRVGSVYRTSPIELVAQLLRPTGPKLLMGVAMLALLIAAGPALGLFDLPFYEGSGVENQATGGADLVGTPAATSTSAPLDEAASPPFGAAGDTSGAEVAAPEITQAPATSAPTIAPTVAPAPTSAEATVSTETTDTTVSETTTSSTVEVTTTLDSTASTDISDPTTDPSSVTTSVVTSTSEPPPTTIVVSLRPGQLYPVPDVRPAGTYAATVPNGDGCLVRVTRSSGGDVVYTADPGELIVFILANGDIVNVSVGCPTAYSVT